MPDIITPLPKTGTRAGNYFISNYPPFSFWAEDQAHAVEEAYAAPHEGTPPALGLYHHIPFCRKRCHFCYFRVYTDKNADQIKHYLDSTVSELEMMASKPLIAGRKPHFIYFGGGTPSYLSASQLVDLTDRMKALLPWDAAEEVAFECEPGTLNPGKLTDLRQGNAFSFLLANGRSYELLARIRPHSIAISIDGIERITTPIQGRALGIVPPWAWNPAEKPAALAIGSYQSATRFTAIEWRPVPADAVTE